MTRVDSRIALTVPVGVAIALGLLAACQGTPATPGPAITPPPPVAGASPGSGACVAPAVVVDAAGKPSVVKTGFAPASSGICVPATDLVTRPTDVVSVGGGFRVSLASPLGAPDITNPKGSLRATVRASSGGQSPVVDADVRFVLLHVEMGGGHGFDPNGIAAVRDAGGYVLEPVAWPMAGVWLVTVMIKTTSVSDHAYFAVDVK